SRPGLPAPGRFGLREAVLLGDLLGGLFQLVAILGRGYGAAEGRNDEALVLAANLPDVLHFQGADRVALARVAVEECESELLVLEAVVQHRRLALNLDVVLIDVTQ